MNLIEQLRRFHAIVTGGAPLDDAQGLIVSDATGAAVRMGVYVHAYTARIADVLAQEYPKLDALLGIRALTADYLQAHPPGHPSLREVGGQLASFLARRGDARHLVDLDAGRTHRRAAPSQAACVGAGLRDWADDGGACRGWGERRRGRAIARVSRARAGKRARVRRMGAGRRRGVFVGGSF